MKPFNLRQQPSWVKEKPAWPIASIRRHYADKAMWLAHGSYITLPWDATIVPKGKTYEVREPESFGHHIAVDSSITRLSMWEDLDHQGKKIIWFEWEQWVINEWWLVSLENDELVQIATLEEILKHNGVQPSVIEGVGRNTPELLEQDHYVVTREWQGKIALFDELRPLDDIPQPRIQTKH